MQFSLAEIAHLVQGEVEGDATAKVHFVSKIEEGQPGTISFLANPKYEKYIYDTKATAVIVNKEFEAKKPLQTNLIRVQNAYSAFTALMTEYQRMQALQIEGVEDPCFISKSSTIGKKHFRGAFSYIGDNVTIGDNVKIYQHAYIGRNVTIGDNCIIYAGAKVMNDCQIGNNCTLHPGCIIGSDGFGFAKDQNGQFQTIPQLGNVILEDYVDIGANTCVDRATMGHTVIGRGTKIDNLCQIAHNVTIGKNTAMAAQCGIAGSTKIGSDCLLGGQIGIIGHLTVADKTQIGAKSSIMQSVKTENQNLWGSPAFDHRKSFKSYFVYRKLPELLKRVEQLEEKSISLPNQ